MNSHDATLALRGEEFLIERSMVLRLGDFRLEVLSNCAELLDALASYFGPICRDTGFDPATPAAPNTLRLTAVEGASPELPLVFRDWQREPGKQGRKDSVVDLESIRIVHKVRTGVVFLQSAENPLARGPLRKNLNQLINFINSQYMNYLQQRDWLITHTASVLLPGGALALGAFSGGGKSTLMLRLLEEKEAQFVSNDRSFLRHDGGRLRICGVPKLPRVNPGTLLHSPRLRSLLPVKRQEQLQELTPTELWELEEKYDVPLRERYGPTAIADSEVDLRALIVLAWDPQSTQSTELQTVDLAAEPSLLEAVMKSPGPFYQDREGRFLANGIKPQPSSYLERLRGQTVFALKGKADFARAVELLRDHGLL